MGQFRGGLWLQWAERFVERYWVPSGWRLLPVAAVLNQQDLPGLGLDANEREDIGTLGALCLAGRNGAVLEFLAGGDLG